MNKRRLTDQELERIIARALPCPPELVAAAGVPPWRGKRIDASGRKQSGRERRRAFLRVYTRANAHEEWGTRAGRPCRCTAV